MNDAGRGRELAEDGRAHRRSIFVLGMHRSGTSALTRVLGLCGADLPGRLVEADPATNERGFWEPRELVALHDEVLGASGSSWHDVVSFPEDWFASVAAQPFRQRAAALLQAEFPDSMLSVVKDPRLCRLMPLWRPVLAELGIAPCAVILIRNPLEVAGSLNKREGFGEGKSLLLWLRHVLAAERDSRGLPRCFVTYDRLLADWRGTIERIGQALAIAWPRGAAEAAPEIDAFLTEKLRHHAFDAGAIRARPDVPSHIKETYDWLIRAAGGTPPPDELLDRIHDEIVRSERVFAPAVVALEAAAKRQTEALHHWVGVADERFAIIEQFRAEIARLTSQTQGEPVPAPSRKLFDRLRGWRS